MNINEQSTILQYVLVITIQTLLPIVLGYVAVFVQKKIKELQGKIDADKLELAVGLARQLVMAAEQSGLAGYLEDQADVKKRWVIENLETELAKRKIFLDLDTLSNLVEAQVMEIFNLNKGNAGSMDWLFD